MARILQVVGARPNFMKAAPLFKELARRPGVEQMMLHTGQHYDAAMSDVFFQDLEIPPPAVNLETGSGSHAQQTAQIMSRFEPVLLDYRPDWVVVPGDVNSTIACALVAVKLGYRVAHVEAGLRSFDRGMPEEINRVLTDQLSDLLLTPSPEAEDNLRREGIDPARIRFVGNIMIDSLVTQLPKAEARWPALSAEFGLTSGKFILATLHRPSNVDQTEPLTEILAALGELAQSQTVIFPVHPRTRVRIEQGGFTLPPQLILAPPQGYLDFLALQKHARLVITDSGGVQEETSYLGIPCLTARPNTERPVTITHGTNRLVASERDAILAAARQALDSAAAVAGPPPLWDGRTAGRIADLLV